MITYGEVVFTVVDDEKVIKSNDITDYPTEDAGVISDNVEQKPLILSISGMIKGENAFEKLQLLRKYSDEGIINTYTGRNALQNCVIESITTAHDNTVKGGFIFTIEFKQILLAELQETNIDFEVVVPQSVNGTKSLGKKSVKSIIEVEEDVLQSDILPYKVPSYSDVQEVINQKIELRNTKGREAMKEQISKFKSDERRRLNALELAENRVKLYTRPGGL